VSLIDDEEGEAALAGQVGESSAELGEEAGKAEGRVRLEGKQDLVVKSSDGEMGVGEVNDGVEIAVEGVGEGAESRGLAGADVAGDESRETLVESKREAALDFLMTARGEEVRAGDGFGEGGSTEAVEVIEGDHCRHSPLGWMVRVARSEWCRTAAG
jgi:hypothetical protein